MWVLSNISYDGDGDGDDNGDDLYIMVKCLFVCMSVTKKLPNYFGRWENYLRSWENYFGRLETYFGRAGGKTILAGQVRKL